MRPSDKTVKSVIRYAARAEFRDELRRIQEQIKLETSEELSQPDRYQKPDL